LKRIMGLFIAILLLGYGVVRIGVGALLLAQTLDIITFPDLAEGVAEVKTFIDARANDQIFPFSVPGYFGYILVMGGLLAAGAVGAIARYRWGYSLLGIYLVMHAALFVNFQEVNPKLVVLILQAIMLFALYYLRPPISQDSVVST
jgi:hypothetical protein